MFRLWRQVLTIAMLALYGSVSLCGNGLHALTERDAKAVSTKATGASEGPFVKAIAKHCTVCEFQTQGQLSADPPAVVSRPFTSPHLPITLAIVASRRHSSASPRAPPFLRASVA